MMRVRVWLPLIVLTVSLLAQIAEASDLKRFNLVPIVGWTFFDKELESNAGLTLNDDLYAGGRLGVRVVSPLWLDLVGGYTETKSRDRDATWTHLSVNLLLGSSKPRAFSPFVSLGGGVSKLVPQLVAPLDGTFEAAAGLKVKFTNTIGLRLEARNVLFMPKKDYSKAHIDNVVAGAGLVFAFGGRDGDGDGDGDGVPDKLDRCRNTRLGCAVGADGCAIDSDDDGVCDGLDQCPNTPHVVTIDAKGCPTDKDGDGVWDGIDQCPDSPSGCTVDARGCSVDSDGDGVCDGGDRCPNTPPGCKVDERGCSIDSDRDSVCDGLDKCPDTPAGATVDPVGCSAPNEVLQRETELLHSGLIRLQDVKFETAKARILLEFRHTLDVVGEVLSKWPQLKIEIGGHCDSRGSDAYNLGLSRRRVTSVRSYLLERFPKLVGAQLTAKGYGESQPLVPNTSPANMAQNRRVEFKVLNKEVLEQLKR